MNFIKLLPVMLSLLLLGAHFFRAGMIIPVLFAVAILFMLLIRKPWVARMIQLVLILGGLEWIRTTIMLVKERQVISAPWERLALILGGVAVLTICSALVFRSKSLRERYGYSDRRQKKSD